MPRIRVGLKYITAGVNEARYWQEPRKSTSTLGRTMRLTPRGASCSRGIENGAHEASNGNADPTKMPLSISGCSVVGI